jgi:uncharacterized protein (DUF2141 family)
MFFKSWLESKRARSVGALFACALALLSMAIISACTVTTATDATTEGTGNLVVNWTIASNADATQCSTYNAQSIAIQVFNASGLQAGSTTASCSSLSASINALPVGNYSIQAQLLDVNGGALASLSAPVAATINDLATTSETVDFPAAAFTTPVAGTGTLTLNWTIASASDATLCASHSAQTMSIQVFNASNIQYGAATSVACSALTASIVGLPAGTYTIQAQMLDVNGASITSLVGPLAETITDGAVTTQAIDFPEDSFGSVTTSPTAGTLSVSWTVAESTAASGCTANNAANIVLQLFDTSNTPVGSAESAACTAFIATLPNVTPGTYTLTAKLVNTSGADVTTTVTIPGIVITATTATAQPIDFATTSFLTSATGTGSINVSWTIESATAVASCGAHNAASISLQLYQSDGVTPVGVALIDPCTAFSAVITNLTPGAYALSAQLVNSTATVSTLIPPQPITVTAGASASQAFDFPASSF